jgi:hypothetical protein
MSIWQTLDIAPTEDESEIRRAYARQLKIVLIPTPLVTNAYGSL